MLFSHCIITGTAQTADNQPIDDVGDRLNRIRQYLADTFGGYTETETKGGWMNPSGELIEETGRLFAIFAVDEPSNVEEAYVAASIIRKELEQHSVCLIGPDSSVQFIESQE